MSDNILQLNQELIHNELKDLVRNCVEETLNALLDHEADELVNAEKYERSVSMLLKAIHAQECKISAKEKAKQVADKLREMKLTSAAKKVEDGIEETLTYMDFPSQHWTRIRTNNTIERLNREIKRRTRAIGAFPDG